MRKKKREHCHHGNISFERPRSCIKKREREVSGEGCIHWFFPTDQTRLCILTASFNTTMFPTTVQWWNVQVYTEFMWFYIRFHLIRMSLTEVELSLFLSFCLHHFTSGSSCDWFAADAAKPCHRAFRPKNNLHSLFILCFFPCLFYDFPPRLMFSCPPSSVSHSLTIASRYTTLDGLITPSPSTGQLTERKQWWSRSGICGTRPQDKDWGEISCSASKSKTTKLVGGVRARVGAGKDSSEGEQLIIQPPININADAWSRAQFFMHLWANRWGYCDWCHPDICKSSSRLSQETACDIMLLQMSPECGRRSHVTCRDLERSGAHLGTRGSVDGWRVQQITGFCSIRQVLCSIFLCNTLCRRSGFGV